MGIYANSDLVDLPNDNFNLPGEFKEEPYIKVYLASALTGREQNIEFDKTIRNTICDVFSKASFRRGQCVLKYKVYDPAEHTSPGTPHSPEDVYRIDFCSLVKSDLALFYVNAPSLGVGIERQIAAMACVPCVIVHQTGVSISRMFTGTFSGSVFTVAFASIEEMALKLKEEIAKYSAEFYDKALQRRQMINALKNSGIEKFIFKTRVQRLVTIKELAKDTGIQPFWWTELERDTSGTIAATTLTSIIWLHLGKILQAERELSETEAFRFRAHSSLAPREKQSLETLYEAYVSQQKITDDTILRVWTEYLRLSAPLLDNPVSKEEWIAKFQEDEKLSLLKNLGETYEKLPEILWKSFDNLYEMILEFENLGRFTKVDKIKKIWDDHKPHIIGQKKAARKKPKNTPYSKEDWKKIFDNEDLVKHG